MAIKTKDAGLRLRIEKDLREQFVEICRSEGKAAAHVLREYMRDYVSQHYRSVQRELDLTSNNAGHAK